MTSIDTTVKQVFKLREDIQRHGVLLRQSEDETRNVLVTPLLGVLGWRVGHLDEVRTQYRTATGIGVADYALMSSETKRPEYLIEAKGLETDLKQALPQAMQYSNESGVEKSILTNGDVWMVVRFELGTPKPMEVLESFSVTQEEAVVVALKAEFLRNPITRNDVANAIDKVHTISANLSTSNTCNRALITDPIEPSRDGNWHPLDATVDLNFDSPPVQINFRDGYSMPVASWRDLVKWVGLWLAYHHDYLEADDCNIKTDRARTRYVAHKSRNRLVEPTAVGNGVYVESNVTRIGAIANACKMIEYCGEDQGAVLVRFD